MFKVGDVVRCVDNRNVTTLLKHGNTYTITYVGTTCIKVRIGNKENLNWFAFDRFILSKEHKPYTNEVDWLNQVQQNFKD